MRTRRWWYEQTLIGSIVIATHLLMALALNRFLSFDATASDAVADEPLQVVFLPPPRRERAPPTALPQRRDTAPSAPVERAPAAVPPPPIPAAIAAAPDIESGRPLSAVYVQQAAGQRQRPPPGMDEPRDAFASRVPRLPGEGATLGVPMREAVSAASVIEKVGSLFGGRSSPCPDNRKDIAALATGGDRAALERAVDYERRYCRP